MASERNILVLIPDDWKESVVGILRTGDRKRILSTDTADSDWNITFPAGWLYEREIAMAKALEDGDIEGRHVTDMVPPCDAYEFWFYHEKRKLLGKIGLLPDGRIIMIFSSHIPRKGDAL